MTAAEIVQGLRDKATAASNAVIVSRELGMFTLALRHETDAILYRYAADLIESQANVVAMLREGIAAI